VCVCERERVIECEREIRVCVCKRERQRVGWWRGTKMSERKICGEPERGKKEKESIELGMRLKKEMGGTRMCKNNFVYEVL